jgi:hypothetical protein
MSVEQFLMVMREDACVTVQLEEGGPISLMPQKQLSKRTIVTDDDNETSFAVEYRLPGADRIVHRSVHVQLKRGALLGAVQGEFGG